MAIKDTKLGTKFVSGSSSYEGLQLSPPTKSDWVRLQHRRQHSSSNEKSCHVWQSDRTQASTHLLLDSKPRPAMNREMPVKYEITATITATINNPPAALMGFNPARVRGLMRCEPFGDYRQYVPNITTMDKANINTMACSWVGGGGCGV